jgi:hypothetical protein
VSDPTPEALAALAEDIGQQRAQLAAAATPPPPRAGAAAVGLIVAEEVTSSAHYEAALSHPAWPGEDSGITIGIGYDLGYQDRAGFASDWDERLPAEAMRRLSAVCGLRGKRAETALPALRDITVPWIAARAVFLGTSLPRYEAQTLAAFPGADALPAEAFGALVSLVYNRGPDMGSPADPPPDRRREMRDIRAAIAAGQPDQVPALLLSMRRLWPDTPGLRGRREREAALFAGAINRS